MSLKTKKIIGWVLTVLLAMLFIFSAGTKLLGGADAVKGAALMDISANTVKLFGIIELLSVMLFIIPRTGVLGTLLLAAYIGGAIATHVEHQFPVVMPVIVECVIWITAALRFPELTSRLMSKNVTS